MIFKLLLKKNELNAAQAYNKGIEQGMNQGTKKATKEIADKMITAKITGISIYDIENLSS